MTTPDHIEFSPPAGVSMQFWVGNTYRLHFPKEMSVQVRDWLVTLANRATIQAKKNVAELKLIEDGKRKIRYERVLPEVTASKQHAADLQRMDNEGALESMGTEVPLINAPPIQPTMVAVGDAETCEMMNCIHPPAEDSELCDMHLAQAESMQNGGMPIPVVAGDTTEPDTIVTQGSPAIDVQQIIETKGNDSQE